jgi:ectoine hydroxylase-related dioxygenase (phytanoyl-CoA dioxygenase family)
MTTTTEDQRPKTDTIQNVAAHANQIKVNGYTVIEDVIPLALIAAMQERFEALIEAKRQAEPSNRGVNRFQMYLPFEPPFDNPLVYENEAVLAVVEQVLGPDPACLYFASDTPLPGADYQRVHSDTRLLFPEHHFSLPCYGLVLNIPLVDVTEENGPMECWPGGTHLWDGTGDMAELAKVMPSARLTMRAGSVLVRDLRMWHRGTPNRSNHMRPNVALVYTRPWYRFEQKVPTLSSARWERLSERAKKLFRHAIITDG